MSKSNLPAHASLEYLRKLAKTRLQLLRQTDPNAKLAAAQLVIAREHGFASWRDLKAQLESQQAPKKVSNPTVRFIGVEDLSRSVGFYRDVLGFQIVTGGGDEADAVLGPVRIRLGKSGYWPGDLASTSSHPAGSAIVFFQTDDVEAARAEMCRRGGDPSDIEKVNWIKMRMFEIRDPDGNVLWFGQSYHKYSDTPSRRKQQPRGLRQALPEMPFDNVAAAVDYYRDVLGFRINHQQNDLGVMDRDAITILLISRTEQHKGIGSFEVYVEDADALYEELRSKGANVQGPPVSHPWGLREFQVVDIEGNRITFGQTFE